MHIVKKYKKLLLTTLILMLALLYVWFSYFRVDYSETKWLTLYGYKSKGYEPYLKTVYGASGDECKDFVFGLGKYLSKNEKNLLMADISEDDLHYTIRYPMNFKKGGCEYWFGRGYVGIQEYNDLDEKKYPRTTTLRNTKIYDGIVGMYDIKYFKPNETYSLGDKNTNSSVVNQYCQRYIFHPASIPDKWAKIIDCHPQGFYGNRPFFFFEPFILKHPNFEYNIVVSEEVKEDGTKDELKKVGLEEYIDEDFKPTKEMFEAFKEKYNIKEK